MGGIEKLVLSQFVLQGTAHLRNTQNNSKTGATSATAIACHFYQYACTGGRDLDELVKSLLEVCYGKGVALRGGLFRSFLCDPANRHSRCFPICPTTREYQENGLTIGRADLEVVNGRQPTLRRRKGGLSRRRFAKAQPCKKPAPLGCSPQLF